jgi:nitrile hydratase beta subunit
MNGIHDLGGMHGFGPVVPEPDEPVFHAAWEGTLLAIQQVTRALGCFNVDEFRYGIERMPPQEYLAASYYERWLASIETNLREKGIVSLEELDARMAQVGDGEDSPERGADNPALLQRLLHAPAPELPADAPAPRFGLGDSVRTRNVHPSGHTRLPRYARGKAGRIARVHGTATLPDASALGRGAAPQPLYSVEFEGRELWGDSAEPGQRLYLDLWETYLELVR